MSNKHQTFEYENIISDNPFRCHDTKFDIETSL